MALGDRLKAVREAAGLTQEALARKADLSVSTVAKIEHYGIDPAWSTVIRLARALDVRVSELDDSALARPSKPAAAGKRAKSKGKK
jgi:transcriptional regulator with XRE-family HTH domain